MGVGVPERRKSEYVCFANPDEHRMDVIEGPQQALDRRKDKMATCHFDNFKFQIWTSGRCPIGCSPLEKHYPLRLDNVQFTIQETSKLHCHCVLDFTKSQLTEQHSSGC
jgi:hypothetical protein